MGSLSQIPMQRYYFFAKITDTILAYTDKFRFFMKILGGNRSKMQIFVTNRQKNGR